MPTLRIEHPVPDFDMWKRVFDSDPAQREAGPGGRVSSEQQAGILEPVETREY